MKYIVVAGSYDTERGKVSNFRDFENKVNQKIKEGYEPIGGLAIAPEEFQVYQAMINRSLHPS